MPTIQEKHLELQSVLTLAYQTYEKMLNKHAFFKVCDHAISKELVQTTFMKTWIYLVKAGKIDLMKAFLYHTLNHLIIDEYRKCKTTSLEVLLEKGFQPSAGNSGRLFNILDGKIAIDLIQHLPNIYQEVMRLRYVQELSIKEISIVTGQTKNTVAVQAHRGLGKLKLLFNYGVKKDLIYA